MKKVRLLPVVARSGWRTARKEWRVFQLLLDERPVSTDELTKFMARSGGIEDLPPWAPRQLFHRKAGELRIHSWERDEMPEVVLERTSPSTAAIGDRQVKLSFQAAHQLAGKIAAAIEAATGQGGRTRESVFLDPDPGEVSIYTDAGMVVLYVGPGDVVPDLKSTDPDAELLASEIAGRGAYPVTVELLELAVFDADEAREALEALEAALAVFD